MDKAKQLRELADRVEGGYDQPDFVTKTDWDISKALGHDNERIAILVSKILQGSLDAAKALHDSVLPGWTVEKIEERSDIKTWWVKLGTGSRTACFGETKEPSAAWVTAILRAKAWEIENE